MKIIKKIICFFMGHNYKGWTKVKGQPTCNRCEHKITTKEFVDNIFR